MTDKSHETLLSSQGLPRKLIVRGRKSFDRLFREGTRLTGEYVSLAYMCMETGEVPCQIGFACGKRIGGAVVRNRQKRRMREIMRTCKQHIDGWQIVLIARPSIIDATFDALRVDILDLLEKIPDSS